jgi:hypothetical protein
MKKFGGSWRARLNPWLGFKRKWKKEEDMCRLPEEQFTWTSFYNRSGLLAHGLFFICCIVVFSVFT